MSISSGHVETHTRTEIRFQYFDNLPLQTSENSLTVDPFIHMPKTLHRRKTKTHHSSGKGFLNQRKHRPVRSEYNLFRIHKTSYLLEHFYLLSGIKLHNQKTLTIHLFNSFHTLRHNRCRGSDVNILLHIPWKQPECD